MSNIHRSEYIGSYDAGCILGTNEYRPRRLVWEEKVNRENKSIENSDIARGNAMEPIIERWMRENVDPTINNADMFMRFDSEAKTRDKESITGTSNQIFMRHPELPFVGGHPDGIGLGEAQIPIEEGGGCYYEFKAPRMRKLVDTIEGSLPLDLLEIGCEVTMEQIYESGVPRYWLDQVQHGLLCTGLPRGELVIWDYDQWRPLRIPVRPDKKLHELMMQEYEIFWTCVEAGIPPQGDTPLEMEWCQLITDDELDQLCREYNHATSMRYRGQDLQREVKAKLLSYLGDRRTVITPNFSISVSYVDKGTYGYTKIITKDRNE